MNTSKVCFKCGIEKKISDFYIHNLMTDGHLGKCKICTRNDSAIRELRIRSTQEGIEKERERHREKYHRLGYKDKQRLVWNKDKFWLRKNLYKRLHSDFMKLFPLTLDVELHHWNYNDLYSVFVFNKSFHRRLHRHMSLDTETLYYKSNGKPMDTMEKHLDFIRMFANKLGITDDIIFCDLSLKQKFIFKPF